MAQKKIAQLHSVMLRSDAVSNMMKAIDRANRELGYDSAIAVDLFSEYPEIPQLGYLDYDKTPMIAALAYISARFLRLDQKAMWLRKYVSARQSYKPGVVREVMEKADIRIWHFGAFYTLFRYFHEGDILFYHGITYPYLSYFSEFGFYSKNMLQAILDMKPFVIVSSNFIKQSLIDLGFKPESIHILPLFHKYNLPYQERAAKEPKLIAWGRYALNKDIPELVKACNQYKLPIRIFGDNFQTKEYSNQYKQALKENSKGYAKLSGKVEDFEAELNQANIYISNSYHEGFNLPLVESEAHSFPVLARRGTAMGELVKDGYNGFLFSDINEVPSLVDKIMKDYKRFSYNAWKHSQNYTYEKFKERYLRILKEYKASK